MYNTEFTNTNHKTYIFAPFETQTPADITAQATFSGNKAHKAPISPSGGGWVEKPDAGKTELSKEAPVGEPWILFFLALCLSAWQLFRRRQRLMLILVFLFSLLTFPIAKTRAGVTAIDCCPATAVGNQSVTVSPIITSAPASAFVCWGLYYDAAATNELEGLSFSPVAPAVSNEVSFTAPSEPGTYYIKTSVRSGAPCDGLVDSYVVVPFVVYPTDADLVLSRDAHAAPTRINLTDDETIRAYGAMRFSRSVLNDETRSRFERFNYFVSFPFDVQVADIYGIGEVGSHWLIYYYDGKGRAEEGFFAERTDNWVMIDDTDSILHAGQGYLLQLNALQMAADATWTNDKEIATLYFPAYNAFNSVATAVNETIPALGEAYRCTIDMSAELGSSEADRRAKDSYWRCLGVPSMSTPSGVENMDYFYQWNMADNSLEVTSAEGFAFEPMHAYLVQNGDEIVWTGVSKPAAVVAREHTYTSQEWCVLLKQGDRLCDRTYIRLTDDEHVTEAFDFGRDLIKELNAGRANIYSMVGYERLAANSLPNNDKTMVVPLGLRIAEFGDYTIVLENAASGSQVTLVDQLADKRTKIGEQGYTVSLGQGSVDTRFVIEFGAQETPTGWEQADDARQASGSVRKMMIAGVLYVVRDGKVYDIRGVRIR